MDTNHKFKVGDRVRRIAGGASGPYVQMYGEYTVRAVRDDSIGVEEDNGKGDETGHYARNFELIEEQHYSIW